jgi:hypothetical protein
MPLHFDQIQMLQQPSELLNFVCVDSVTLHLM